MKNPVCIIFIFYLIYLSGCGKNDERYDEDSRMYGVKTEDLGTKDTVSSKKINTMQKLPADFPSDIPIYINAKILASSSGDNPMATLETDDNTKDVCDFYKTEMKKNGYSSDSFNDKLQNKDNGIMIFSKEGKQYTISYMYNEAKFKTLITIQTRGTNK